MNNPELRSLSELLRTERGQHKIPFFQRNYSWDATRVKLFIEYIFEISENGMSSGTNFIGFMVTQPPERSSGLNCTKFSVIDGQQRLTTFSVIIICLIKFAMERIQELEITLTQTTEPDKIKTLADSIKFYSEQIDDLKYKYIENKIFQRSPYFEDRLRFVPQEVDREIYQIILEHGDLSNVNDSDNLKIAYIVILSKLRKELKNPSEQKTCENFLKFIAAAENLEVVQLELQPSDDPQKIFETINDRGKPLSSVDLIRNTTFSPSVEMQITEEDTKRWHKEYWKKTEKTFYDIKSNEDDFTGKILFSYVRCILTKNGDYITIKGLNNFFNQKYTSKELRLTFLDSFKKLCLPYIALRGCDQAITDSVIESDSGLKKELSRLQDLDFQAVNPFLLKLFEDNVSQKEIKNVASLFERFFVRRSICGETVKVLPKILTKLTKEYNDNFPFGGQLTVSQWIIREFKNDQESTPEERFYNYPTDHDVVRSLKTTNLYAQGPDLVKYILLRVNEHVMPRDFPGKIDKLQIEHVLPQKLSKEWQEYLKLSPNDRKVMHEECVGLIGNLALTKSNQVMSNSLFSVKKEFLSQSPYKLTNELGSNQFSNWIKSDIYSRNEYITNLIITILPDLS